MLLLFLDKKNLVTNMLTNVASRFTLINDEFTIKLIFSPSIPDNVTNWRTFNNDQHIVQFLTKEYMFMDEMIDDKEHSKALQEC